MSRFNRLHHCSPLPAIGLLVVVGACMTIAALALPHGAVDTNPPGDWPAPSPFVSSVGQLCLAVEEPHFYSRHPYNEQLARPGSMYKESPNAAGPSAVPVDFAALGAYDRLMAVRAELVLRLCGNATVGGDPVLFAMLQSHAAQLLGMAAVAGSNTPVTAQDQRQAIGDYLATVIWSESEIVEEIPPEAAQTAMMVESGGMQPTLQVTSVNPAKSHYLKLALAGNDQVAHQWLRLECGFQVRFDRPEHIPQDLQR